MKLPFFSMGERLFSKNKKGYWSKGLSSSKYAEAPLPSSHLALVCNKTNLITVER